MNKLLTNTCEEGRSLLARPAKRVKNPQATETIIAIQTLKKLALGWEQETRSRCEGLAATQAGIPLRLAILRQSDEMACQKPRAGDFVTLLAEADGTTVEDFDELGFTDASQKYRDWLRSKGSTYDPWRVLINPVILKQEGHQWSDEGCLSVPGSSYKVSRPEIVFFKYTTPANKPSPVMVAKGYSACALMHEIDHLNGTLISNVAVEAYIGTKTAEL